MEKKIYKIIATLNKNGVNFKISELMVHELDKVYKHINSETNRVSLINKSQLGLNKSKLIQKIDYQTQCIYCLPENLDENIIKIKTEFNEHYIYSTNLLTELISNQNNITITYN